MKRNLKNFVDAGYKKKSEAQNVNGYILDKELSTKRNKVYYDPNTGKAVHTIAGTDTLKDWSNNALIPLGLHQYSNRSKNSTRIQKKANEKYGKSNVDLVTHSQSGHIAENLANKNLVGGHNTTLNPAIIGAHNKDIKVVKSVIDPVSLLTKTTKNDVKIIPKTFNPIAEHSTNILDKSKKDIFHPLKKIFGHGLKESTNIQSILFKRPEWKLTECKKWLKKHKYKYDVDKKPNHYRFRQFEPTLFKHYITKKIGDNIELIIGLKNKKDIKSMKYNSEDESEASTSEEENEKVLKGSGLKSKLHEQELLDRMAKLSHDIHHHHQVHGYKKNLFEGYKVMGHGLVHSIKGGSTKKIKNFNSWFKAIGQKFKPLNKNLQPIKQAATRQAVANIESYTATPEQQAQTAMNLFNQGLNGITDSGTLGKSSTDSYGNVVMATPVDSDYQSKYKPVIAQPIAPDPYDFNSQPSSYARSYQPTASSGYGIGKELKKTAGKATVGLINAGSSRAINEMETRNTTGKGLGCGIRKGRFAKGSKEAKEWGEKMRASRAKK